MKLKEQQQSTDPQLKSGFETLLLQSQSGLNMLHDMNNARASKWQHLSSRYGTPLAPPASVDSGAIPVASSPSAHGPNELLVARALQLARQKEQVCRLALSRNPALTLDPDNKLGRTGSSQTRRRRQDALVTALARAMDTQHRLRPPSAAESAPVGPFGRRSSVNAGSSMMHQNHRLRVEDLESLLRFAYVQQTHSVALDRFFIRLKWMLTSHRYHLRQRMLELVHTQQTKTAGITSLQCPLFVISTSRLDAELKHLLQKFAISELSAHGDASLLRDRVDRVVVQSLQATAILDRPQQSDNELEEDEDEQGEQCDAEAESSHEPSDVAMESLVERHHWMRSRWDLSQFEIFDNQQSQDSAHYRSSSHAQSLDDESGGAATPCQGSRHVDRLVHNELEVVRMGNFEYVQARMEARALGHFDYAFIDLQISNKQDFHVYHPTATDEGKPPTPTLFEQAMKEAAGATQAQGTPAMRADLQETAKQLWQPDILYSYYMLRLISCRAKRHRLLRLLNYFHYIQLTRGNQQPHASDQTSTNGASSTRRHMSEPLSGIKQSPLSVERRQNEYVVVQNRAAPSCKRDGKPNLDSEVIFPMARHDLENIERQMLHTASVFIANQEAKSLPKPASDSEPNTITSAAAPKPTRVMAIDRMQVICDLYDSELNFQQAKLQLVQRLIANGLEADSGEEERDQPHRSSSNEVIVSLLRRRPLLDFSLEYFYDSYAKETLHLDLQANLQQQIQQYIAQVQQVHHHPAGSHDIDFWITHQILLRDGALRFHELQRQILQEADLKWFSPRAVCEFHALRQAIYEKMLVVWKIVLNVELIAPDVAGVQSLERNASDMLHGNGWQLTVSPQMLMDVCQNLSVSAASPLDETGKASDSGSLVETLIEGLQVVEWRYKLGQLVYESSVLERIACFQFEFVARIESADQPQHFFFEATQCDGSRLLQPLGIELIAVNDSRFQTLFSQEPHKHSRTVAEWLDAQIGSGTKNRTNDHAACADHAAAAYRTMLLGLQQSWVEFMAKSVRYQDFVGAHVFEFAASSPFLFHRVALRRSRESSSATASGKNSAIEAQSTNFKAARSKYMGEIAEKMKEDMQKRCFPYWIRVELLKELLRKRFLAPAYRPRTTVMQDESQEDDSRREAAALAEAQQRVAACNNYLNTEGGIPHLLVSVDNALEIVRNEQRFMNSVTELSVKPIRNAFSTKVAEEGSHDVSNALNQWLTSRLRQLQEDLNGVQDLPDNTSSDRFGHRAMDTMDATFINQGEEPTDLLLALPTSRHLLNQFGVALGRDQPSPIAAKTLRESNKLREDTLVVMLQILDQFLQVLTLLRLQCGFRSLMTITNPNNTSRRRRWESADDQANALMQRWQTQFHEEILRFQESLTECLGPSLAMLNLFTPIQHQEMDAARALLSKLRQRTQELQGTVRCVASFLQIQTIASASAKDHLAGCSAESLLQRDLLNILAFLRIPASPNDVATASSAPTCYSLASAGQAVVFSDAVTPELMRYGLESTAFWNSLTRRLPEAAYMDQLHEWLQLQRVFVLEFVQQKRRSTNRLPPEYSSDHTASHPVSTELMDAGLRALERVWQRYHLFKEQDATSQATRIQPPTSSARPSSATEPNHNSAVSGDSLGMKRQFFGISSDNSSSSAIRRGSVMARNMAMLVANDQQQQHGLCDSDENDCSFLPSATELTSQIAYLRRHFEIQWVQADIDQIQRHFEEFLHKKQQFQSPGTLAQPAARAQSSRSHLMLLALDQFYRPPSSEAAARVVTNQDSDGALSPPDSELCGEFVIPASVMHRMLDDLARDCETHARELTAVYEQATQNSRSEQHRLQLDLVRLKAEREQYEREEAILRESFAMDKIYHLNFQMQTLKQEMQAMKSRTTLEQQALRCELNAQYDQRLRTLNLQLVTKQQQFEEYRATMQHDLHVQLQGAHNQVVQQLVDQSGTLTVETKSLFLASLKGQEAQEHLAKENVTLKQTLLRLQALVEMQQQTQHAAREREQLTQQRYAMKSTLLETENAQLQQQILQLETDLSKVNHEKTMVQLRWNHLQKQTEQSAQKRREAKIRSLSAPYHRASVVPPELESPVPCESPRRQSKESELSRLVSPPRRQSGGSNRLVPDFEAQQEEFEQQHERAIRKPRPSTTSDSSAAARVQDQFQSSLRHYQSEIRRLQQQVLKESRVKSTLMDQVLQLREILGEDSNAVPELEESLAVSEQDAAEKEVAMPTPPSARLNSNQMQQLRAEAHGFAPHAQLQLALHNPRARAASASPICTPRRPPSSAAASASHTAGGVKRPSTSFAPRASQRPTSSSAASASSRAATVIAPPTTPAKTRKFQVHRREDPRLGTVEGVPNVLSAREPLPYR